MLLFHQVLPGSFDEQLGIGAGFVETTGVRAWLPIQGPSRLPAWCHLRTVTPAAACQCTRRFMTCLEAITFDCAASTMPALAVRPPAVAAEVMTSMMLVWRVSEYSARQAGRLGPIGANCDGGHSRRQAPLIMAFRAVKPRATLRTDGRNLETYGTYRGRKNRPTGAY